MIRDLALGNQFQLNRTLVELASRSKILLDSIDNWILSQPSLINARKKTILAVVQQRQVIADGLTRIMKNLGLKRVTKALSLKGMIQDALKEQEHSHEVNGSVNAESCNGEW